MRVTNSDTNVKCVGFHTKVVWIALTRGFCPCWTPSPATNVTPGWVLVILLTAHLSPHVDLLPGSRLSEESSMLFWLRTPL